MEMLVHVSEGSLCKHDHATKSFQYRNAQFVYDEWMLNKLNSMFGGNAVACYTTKPTLFRTEVISHLSLFLFFDDRPPTFIQISEWMTLDRVNT